MKYCFFPFLLSFFTACAQDASTMNTPTIIQQEMEEEPITLDTYLTDHDGLDQKVDSVFRSMDDRMKIAQLIMPAAGRLGKSEERIRFLIEQKYVGGLLLLNGSKDQFTGWVQEYNQLNDSVKNLPLFFSADAEPSLVNRKISGSQPVMKANSISSTEQAKSVAERISNDLNEIGINYNFAPVVDLSSNRTVGYRGFGSNPENVIPFSKAFIEQSQRQNIIATAKHFPGHGLVSGDTHKSLQMIDGELKEVKYYPDLIEAGVLSIMVAHIAVKNNQEYNTHGLPATTSEVIVRKLLREQLGFKGLIVTDAMGMGGVVNVPKSSVKAINAGCDILLMPRNAVKAHLEISEEFNSNDQFKEKVLESVKRIIRMKICLGLIE